MAALPSAIRCTAAPEATNSNVSSSAEVTSAASLAGWPRGFGGEPEVAQRPGRFGERDEGFVGDVGEADRGSGGEGVFGAQRHDAWLGDQHVMGNVVGVDGQ